MICRKLLFRNLQTFLLLVLLLLLSLVSLSTVTFASVSEIPEIIQDEQTETSDLPLMSSDQSNVTADQPPEMVEQDQEIVQDEQSEEEPEVYDHGETMGFDVDESSYYIPYSDTDSEILLTLKSIEYQLKIIAGAMVLMIIIWFIWFTIYKPIKSFL